LSEAIVSIRFEPTLKEGQLWRVDICIGSRKKGTFRAVAVTDPVYTLAQARTFCANNKLRDFAHLLKDANATP
jgi:hypothetical protein